MKANSIVAILTGSDNSIRTSAPAHFTSSSIGSLRSSIAAAPVWGSTNFV
jgi:hypothetical protein